MRSGLDGWTYERIECTADELPALVGGFGPEWVGVSVTMPGKFAALRFADERTPRAELVGSANTLVRSPRGWRADNTDVDGVTGALGTASGHAMVVGSGGTAPAVVVGLAELGVQRITIAGPQSRQGGAACGSRDRARRRGRLADIDDAELARVVAGVGRGGQHGPGRRGGAVRAGAGGGRRCCSTRSTTRGRHRWPRRSKRPAAG